VPALTVLDLPCALKKEIASAVLKAKDIKGMTTAFGSKQGARRLLGRRRCS
jgi:hypothetical protein